VEEEKSSSRPGKGDRKSEYRKREMNTKVKWALERASMTQGPVRGGHK